MQLQKYICWNCGFEFYANYYDAGNITYRVDLCPCCGEEDIRTESDEAFTLI